MLSGKLADVVSQLKGADGQEMGALLEELALQDAQSAWQELVTFATNIQESSMTTVTGSPPLFSSPA